MNIKIKLALKYPIIKFQAFRANRIVKKISKLDDEEAENRYPAIWRNNLVLKRAKKMLKLLNVKVEVIGFDDLPKTVAMLAPNHCSYFDPALILVALEDKRPGEDYVNKSPIFLAKDDVAKDKRVKGYAKLIDTFYIDRKNARKALKTFDEFARFAKEGHRYPVVFPSGTRSKSGKVGEFKPGAFRMAKKEFMPIVPVTINNALSITNAKRKGKLKVQVIFHKAIKPMSFITNDTQAIAKRVKTIVESKWVKPEGKRSKKEQKLA